MTVRKLKLDLDALAVESFEADDSLADRATVFALSDTNEHRACSGMESECCTMSCDGATTCEWSVLSHCDGCTISDCPMTECPNC
jgi:hypothetical protein